MSEEQQPQINRRISTVERQLYEFKSHMATFEANIDSLKITQDQTNRKLDNITNMVQNQSRTNWSVLGTWAAIIIGLITTLGAAAFIAVDFKIGGVKMLTDLNYQRIEASTADRWTEKEQSRYQIMIKDKHDDLEGELKELDTVVQREMRILDDVTNERIKSLDKLLQMEMKANRNEIMPRLLAVEEQLLEQREVDKLSIANRAEFDARLKMLEVQNKEHKTSVAQRANHEARLRILEKKGLRISDSSGDKQW